MGRAFDPKLNRGVLIADDWDDYSSVVAPQPAEHDKYRAMVAKIKLMRDPEELALIQPEAREKLRTALRMALALPEMQEASSCKGEATWELRPILNPREQKFDKRGEPIELAERRKGIGKIRTEANRHPDGISPSTRERLMNLGLKETDRFPSATTLRKVLAVYKAKPIVMDDARLEAIRVIEEAIGWTRERRTRHQMDLEAMYQGIAEGDVRRKQ
jgi:hypothetical protein